MKLESVGIYTRVSTALQFETGSSLEEQQTRTRKYCESMGWPVFKVYTDGGFSGGNLDRPALQEMISDVKEGRINRVLVYKLDRLSRSQRDTLNLIENVFLANSCDFVSMSENFDTSTPFGRASIGILAVFAQLEREQIKERMSMGRDARAKKGLFRGSPAPVGYDYTDGHLLVNEFEALQIRKAFEWYSQGVGVQSIVNRLNESGYHHKYGEWNSQRIRYALRNRTYIGLIKHRDEYIQGVHVPIIDTELFEAVQNVIERHTEEHKKYNRRFGKVTSNLGGLLYCGCCGAKYSKLSRYYKLKNGDKKPYYRYVCNSRSSKNPDLKKDPNCKNKSWVMEKLDSLVFEQILGLRFEPLENVRRDSSDERDTLKRELDKISAKMEKLIDLYSMDGIAKDKLQEKITDLSESRSRLEIELKAVEENRKTISLKKAESVINDFQSILDRGDQKEIRAAVGELVEKIVLNGDDVTIYWAFA